MSLEIPKDIKERLDKSELPSDGARAAPNTPVKEKPSSLLRDVLIAHAMKTTYEMGRK